MFDMQSVQGIAVSDDLEQPRARRKARRRVVRDPGKMDRYEERKLAGLCTTCGKPAAPDRQQCADHLESARESNSKYMTRLRQERRARGECASGCGRKSTTYRCFVCAVRAGEVPAFSPAESGVDSGVDSGRTSAVDTARAIHIETVTRDSTDADGRTRHRFRGSGKRGGANQTAFVVDGQDLRYAKAALEKAIAGMVAAEAPDVKAKPRIQRESIRREWQAFADLARRHLDELLERGGYDDEER
jgi:hypothetical protein